MSERPRVAIAHDYLTQRGGAERVVLAMARTFPDATVHTTLYNPETTYPEFADVDIRVSPLNWISALRRNHRLALPLLPQASSRMEVDADVVIASSSGFAHGFQSTGRTLVYCHAPARWLYHADDYLGEKSSRTLTNSLSSLALSVLTPPLRRWDQEAAQRADAYVANSHVVRDRIWAAYGIEAEVLPPPHGVTPGGESEVIEDIRTWRDYHLVVSRLLPYKNVDIAVEAFRGLEGERLVVIGDGPLREQILADLPDNVRLLSNLNDAQMRWAYDHARALIGPSIEDFGLTPLEAAAFGKPTVALRGGGYLDTVVEGLNGTFFETPTAQDISDGVRAVRAMTWRPAAIAAHAESFGEDRFAEKLRTKVDTLLTNPRN